MRWTTLLLAAPKKKLRGTVISWHPFERRGSIVCAEDQKTYAIPNARAFETILPTQIHSLVGAHVEFMAISSARETDSVITRNRVDEITAKSYMQPTPVDFLAVFRSDTRQEEKDTPSSLRGGMKATLPERQAVPTPLQPELFAGNIVVDLDSLSLLPDSDRNCIRNRNSDAVDMWEAEDGILMGGIPAPLGLKDLRNTVVLDSDTKELLRLRRRFGDEKKAREELERRRRELKVAEAQKRTVLATEQTGIVLAWSQLYRSGVVLCDVTALPDSPSSAPLAMEGPEGNVCIIRNVDAFDTALPTALDLVGRIVTFKKVTYTAHPSKVFAENITVSGEINFEGARASAVEAKVKESAEAHQAKRTKQFGTLFDDAADESDEPLPSGPLYGVVTRWSGGQGIIETGNRRLYYIRSAADFVQLIDQKSSSIRGAVVCFNVDPKDRRNAKEISVLSLAVRDTTSTASTLGIRDVAFVTDRSVSCGSSGVECAAVVAEPPAAAAWIEGMIVTWSPLEAQAVIEGDDGNRYLIRDGEENIVDYKSRSLLLRKGRRVRFTSEGVTGRLASNVTLLDEEADEATIAEAELHERQSRLSDGHGEEAIASPLSTAYWISRMDKVGYDTAEVKRMQNKAITFEDDDDEDDKLLDSEDLFKKDHWFNDPRKNMRLPNSDVTAGNLALIGPASMMNIAMKAHDPKKLEKMKDKYYNRLTEPMKEYAWKQAKELAPKYEKRIKDAQEKGEEPRFSFY
ncbi:uncharacterized protein TEOVI_000501000 [Trypanosoma equiperdum]|uniref:Uncharacterized protein n=1 Tax=Trypanosoma equiperdum TaxID=5694 RepID=A0A1G4I5Z7_TRYEQ|nr:hypothetical protein, conserved [Trypanosoma equiperdum]